MKMNYFHTIFVDPRNSTDPSIAADAIEVFMDEVMTEVRIPRMTGVRTNNDTRTEYNEARDLAKPVQLKNYRQIDRCLKYNQ